MKKRNIIATIISLLVLSGAIGLSACATIASAEPQGGIGAQVNTAVAATLAQYMIETEVATQAIAMGLAPAAPAQTTSTPLPTPTPIPTDPPQLTATATAVPPQPTATLPPPPPTAAPAAAPASVSGLTIIADENTNCRVGPSTGYGIQTYFTKGTQSTVQGRDKNKDWWYIVNPQTQSGNCWVWDGSTTVKGDASTLPVVDAPVGAIYNDNNLYYGYNGYNNDGWGFYGYNYDDCWDHPYNNYCWGSVNWSKYWSKNCGCNQTNPNKWWKCNPAYYNCNCTCKPVFNINFCKNNYCKKSGCPPVTEVNFKNYCKKYPNCCDEQ